MIGSEKPDLQERDPYRFAPIFVLAPARSFSSVVTAMFGAHPDLVGTPELKLFCCGTIAELEATLPRFWIERGITHRSPGLVRAIAEFEFGDQTPLSLALARIWLRERSNWSGAAVLDALLERVHPRTVIEKSPENVASDAALNRLVAAYPQARYVHLTRHPVSTQRSLQKHLCRLIPSYLPIKEPMAGIASWLEVHQRIINFGVLLPGRRYLRLRAEDVLNDSRAQLFAVSQWLQIRTDDRAIEAMMHPEASPFARFGPVESGMIGGNDPSFLSDPVPRRADIPSRLDQPRGWDADPCLWDMVVDLAGQLGYGQRC